MQDQPVVLYDANVLYPAQLRDFLMRLALGEVVRAHWTESIHEEWTENVHADYPDITMGNLRRVRKLMDEALPEALASGFEGRKCMKLRKSATDCVSPIGGGVVPVRYESPGVCPSSSNIRRM